MSSNFKKITVITFLFIGSYFSNAQHFLPELPKCPKINTSQHQNLEHLILKSEQKYLKETLNSFCLLKNASNNAETNKEKYKIALNAGKIGSQLYTNGKYKDAVYFQSLAGRLWSDLDSTKRFSRSLRKIGEIYHKRGDIYNSLSFLNKAKDLNEKNDFNFEKYNTYIALAWAYRQIRNFNEARKYIFLSKSMIDNKIVNETYYNHYYLMSMLARTEEKIPLAMQYNDSAIAIAKKEKDLNLLALAISNKSNFLIYINGNIDSILTKINFAIKINKQMNDKYQLNSNYGVLAKGYLYDKNYSKAIEAANIGLKYAIETGNLYGEALKYKILKNAYHGKKDFKKAFYYSEKYNTFYKEIYGFKDFNRIFEIQKKHDENLNNKIIKNLKITNQQNKRIYWLTSIIALLLFIGIVSYFLRSKKNQKQKNNILKEQLTHELLQMEMEALRSRMNPHFIFNSLNAIKSFIISNDVKNSVSYFSKFAKLLRYSLNNSSIDFVSLDDEINFLKDYVALENLRLSYSFNFTIEITNNLNTKSLKVPPLIIQPFIENAIWHGLSLKKINGKLLLKIITKNNFLEIHIIDNGIGRKASVFLNKNKTYSSKGISITTKRLSIFSKIYNFEKSFEIIDLNDGKGKANGTKVIIKLPLLYENNLAFKN